MEKIDQLKRFALTRIAPGAVLITAGAAHAAVDVASVVTEIEGNVSSVVAIGGAVLLVIVAAAAFKWVRRALS